MTTKYDNTYHGTIWAVTDDDGEPVDGRMEGHMFLEDDTIEKPYCVTAYRVSAGNWEFCVHTNLKSGKAGKVIAKGAVSTYRHSNPRAPRMVGYVEPGHSIKDGFKATGDRKGIAWFLKEHLTKGEYMQTAPRSVVPRVSKISDML
jgi:hypothetical protein